MEVIFQVSTGDFADLLLGIPELITCKLGFSHTFDLLCSRYYQSRTLLLSINS